MTVTAADLRSLVAQPIRKAIDNDFLRHSALLFGATMLGNICNYLFNFALSRRLGVEGFATLSSLVSFLMILSIPMTVVSLVVVKYTGIYHANGDGRRIRALAQVLIRAVAGAGALLFVCGVLLQYRIAAFLRIDDGAAIVLCLAIIAISLVTQSVRSVLQGEQDFKRFAASTLLEVMVKLVAAVALVYAGFGVGGAMFGWFVGSACALAYTLWAALAKHASQGEAPPALGIDVRRLLRTTAGVGFATGFLTFISFMDVLLVKHYFDAHQAGLYAAVNLTGKVVLFLVSFVPMVVLPKAVAKKESGENPVPLLLGALTITVLLSGGVLAVFGVFPAEVLRGLAGRAFVSGAPLVLQYDAAMCLLAVVTLLVNYRIGIHRFGFLYGFGAVLLGEVVAIALDHHTLWDVVHILLLGNLCAVLVALYGITAPAKQRAAAC